MKQNETVAFKRGSWSRFFVAAASFTSYNWQLPVSGVGIGITIGNRWRAWRLIPGWKASGHDIGWAEAIGFLSLCISICNTHPPPGSHFKVLGDNRGIIEGWWSGCSCNHLTNLIFQEIHNISEAEAVTFHTQYIPSKKNLANRPSRGLHGPINLLLQPIAIPVALSHFIVDFDMAPLPSELHLIWEHKGRTPPTDLDGHWGPKTVTRIPGPTPTYLLLPLNTLQHCDPHTLPQGSYPPTIWTASPCPCSQPSQTLVAPFPPEHSRSGGSSHQPHVRRPGEDSGGHWRCLGSQHKGDIWLRSPGLPCFLRQEEHPWSTMSTSQPHPHCFFHHNPEQHLFRVCNN